MASASPGTKRSTRSPNASLAIRDRVRARGDRARHRHRPPSHPLGLALRSCARHAELVRAGLRPVLPSARQHLHPDLRRLPGVRLHRRDAARLHPVLGPQSAQFRPGRRDPLQRARGARPQSEDHRRRSARDRARAAAPRCGCSCARAPTTRSRSPCSTSSSASNCTTRPSSRAGPTASTRSPSMCAAYTPEWAEPITWVAGRQDPRGGAAVRAAPSRRCWNGAAPSSTRRTASRPCARSRCCRRSPAISTCRAAGCSACTGIGRFPSLIENLDPGGERQAARRRPLQAARRRRRRPAGRAYSDAAAGDARGQALSGEGLPRVRQQHADDLRQHARSSTTR